LNVCLFSVVVVIVVVVVVVVVAEEVFFAEKCPSIILFSLLNVFLGGN
jgi:hypothetical protein